MEAKFCVASLVNATGYKSTKSLEFLRNLVGRVKPTRVLELGTAFGASAAYMASAIEGGLVISVDNYSGMYAKDVASIQTIMDRLGFADKVMLLKGDSRKSGDVLKQAGIVASPEIVFMDADHSYNGLLAEYNGFVAMLPKKHIVIVDDALADAQDEIKFVSELMCKYAFCVTIKNFHNGISLLCTDSEYLIKIADSIKDVSTHG
jgi:predicted O-methyltransferase YrrM